MTAGGEIPSFMSPDPKNPTIRKMVDNGDGSWSIDLKNTNTKVTLKTSDFKSRSSYQFSISGNTLSIKSSEQPDKDAYVEWHSNEGGGSGLVFWTSNRQTKATLVGDTLPGDGYMAFSVAFNIPTE